MLWSVQVQAQNSHAEDIIADYKEQLRIKKEHLGSRLAVEQKKYQDALDVMENKKKLVEKLKNDIKKALNPEADALYDEHGGKAKKKANNGAQGKKK